MGGERGQLDVAKYPTVGKTIVFSKAEGIRAFDDASSGQLTFAELIAPS